MSVDANSILNKLLFYQCLIKNVGGIHRNKENPIQLFQRLSQEDINRLSQLDEYIQSLNNPQISQQQKQKCYSYLEFIQKCLDPIRILRRKISDQDKEKEIIREINILNAQQSQINSPPPTVPKRIYNYKDQNKLLTKMEKSNKDLVNIYQYLTDRKVFNKIRIKSKEDKENLVSKNVNTTQPLPWLTSNDKEETQYIQKLNTRLNTSLSRYPNNPCALLKDSFSGIQELYNDSLKIGREVNQLERGLKEDMNNLKESSEQQDHREVYDYIQNNKLNSLVYFYHKPQQRQVNQIKIHKNCRL